MTYDITDVERLSSIVVAVVDVDGDVVANGDKDDVRRRFMDHIMSSSNNVRSAQKKCLGEPRIFGDGRCSRVLDRPPSVSQLLLF